MRLGGRRILSVLAICAIAFNAMWSAVLPMPGAPAADPFAVICHSGASATDEQSPADNSPPAQVCDHCTLCSAAPAASASPAAAVAAYLTPAKFLHLLRPTAAASPDSAGHNPKSARGPPGFA